MKKKKKAKNTQSFQSPSFLSPLDALPDYLTHILGFIYCYFPPVSLKSLSDNPEDEP